MDNSKFNPLDPLGLFNSRGTLLPQLPDPLGLFRRRDNPRQDHRATIGNPIPIEWADEIIPLKERAMAELTARGYRPQEAEKALHWAEEYVMGIAQTLAPDDRELQKQTVIAGYKANIADRAEKWLLGIQQAVGVR